MNLSEKERQEISKRIEALQNLETYRIFLENLVAKDESRIFTNGGVEHATILMSILFNNTESTARIYCQGFRPGLTERPEYLDSLQAMLDKGVKVQALVKSLNHKDTAAFQILTAAQHHRGNNSIEIRLASPDSIQKIHERVPLAGEIKCDFSVFDDKMVRVEVEPDEYVAFGSFNNKMIAEALIDTFDMYFEKSDQI